MTNNHPAPYYIADSHSNAINGKKGYQLSYAEWIKLLKEILLFEGHSSNHGHASGHADHYHINIPDHDIAHVFIDIVKSVKREGDPSLEVHTHTATVSYEERRKVINEIAENVQNISNRMSVVDHKGNQQDNQNKIVYGDPHDRNKQITYTLQNDGNWLITAGKDVNAVIIDPAGKMIEIHGDHMHVYGDGGNLRVPEELKRPSHSLAEVKAQDHINKGSGHYHEDGTFCTGNHR